MITELDFSIIGSRIQSARLKKGLTQEELAEKVDTNQKHISRIEAGWHRSNLDTIVAIAKALQVSVDYLIADFDNGDDESNLKLIMDDIRGMDTTQLNMLRDSIAMIKKYK